MQQLSLASNRPIFLWGADASSSAVDPGEPLLGIALAEWQDGTVNFLCVRADGSFVWAPTVDVVSNWRYDAKRAPTPWYDMDNPNRAAEDLDED